MRNSLTIKFGKEVVQMAYVKVKGPQDLKAIREKVLEEVAKEAVIEGKDS